MPVTDLGLHAVRLIDVDRRKSAVGGKEVEAIVQAIVGNALQRAGASHLAAEVGFRTVRVVPGYVLPFLLVSRHVEVGEAVGLTGRDLASIEKILLLGADTGRSPPASNALTAWLTSLWVGGTSNTDAFSAYKPCTEMLSGARFGVGTKSGLPDS